jgi:predicted HTH transcriptional regulator
MSTFLTPTRGQSIDALPVQGAGVELLDLGLVAAHVAAAQERGRYQGPPDPLAYLLQRGGAVEVAGTQYATLAGLLCFGRDPQALFPQAVVDLGHYYGGATIATELVHIDKNIGGTLFAQLERVERYLWANSRHGMTLEDESIQRVERHEYPRAVLREITVNMLAHRDYTSAGSACRVQLFRDRIEWINPGGLPDGVGLDSLLTVQVSRNPVILTVLYESGYVEAFGQGLDTVIAVLQREGMRFPIFDDLGAFFQVTIFGNDPWSRPEPLSGERAARPAQALVLTEGQSRVLALLRQQGQLSSTAIQEQLSDRAERTIQHDLKVLVDAGLVTVVGKARAARYEVVGARD